MEECDEVSEEKETQNQAIMIESEIGDFVFIFPASRSFDLEFRGLGSVFFAVQSSSARFFSSDCSLSGDRRKGRRIERKTQKLCIWVFRARLSAWLC